MKKYLLIAVLFGFFVLVLNLPSSETANDTPSNTPLPTGSSNSLPTIELNGKKYDVGKISIEQTDSVNLIPNFTQRLPAYEIVDKHGCTSLVNAGFYTMENTPTGLFIANSEKLANKKNSLLFDGFVSLNKRLFITRTIDETKISDVVQTGPILKYDHIFQNLKINNDKYARRVVAAVSDNDSSFLIFFNRNALFDGPLLSEIPQALKKYEELSGDNFSRAINLDGGSASAFISSEYSLEEISPIGSAFCITKAE